MVSTAFSREEDTMNDDPEHGAQEPFFLGEAAALYDTKAGEAGITYTLGAR